MKLSILASAVRDLEEGFQFYESQDIGVGDYFLASVSADIESLRISAGIHPNIHSKFCRSLCRVFPFAIYYMKVEEVVTIYAMVDCRRNPAWIRHHLERASLPIGQKEK